ncbi:TraB/GumN family protein [Maritalea mediterranea]|uniref:TraB/GumN family protein n=1 Tax=Maritalea mediterranea TaxID=2909667 RepID=A0ABS9EAV6_9HYPH|nr:TraB/GumN family protein [Maritalea mediterranea]MCF4100017.1 TraB/GumN family protein [Maritalea mediterranea]
MKKLLFTSLVFTLTSSFAFAACETRDLVAELQQNDPAAFETLQREAAHYANPEGVFWEVSHESLPHTSYVFGTLHKADPRILDLPANVQAALESAEVVAVEIENADDPSAVGAIIGKNPHLILQPQGETLADDLAESTVQSIDAYLNDLGMDFDTINPLQPWIGATTLSFTQCDMQWGGPMAQVLDMKLVELAKSADVPVVSLETVESQLESISSINEEMFIRSIENVARLYEEGLYDAVLQTMNELYLKEQIGMIIPVQLHFTSQYDGMEDDWAEFQEALLDARNELMVENAARLMDEQSTFVAVGALHLIGDTGLIEGLRNDGFAVTRVPLNR